MYFQQPESYMCTAFYVKLTRGGIGRLYSVTTGMQTFRMHPL